MAAVLQKKGGAKKLTAAQRRRQKMLQVVEKGNEAEKLQKFAPRTGIDLDKAFGSKDKTMEFDEKVREVSGIVEVPISMLTHPTDEQTKDENALAAYLVGVYAENVKFEYVDEFKFSGCQDCLGLFCANCSSGDVLGCDKGRIYVK